jgi:hypothetical protein
MPIWTPEKVWSDRDVFIIGGGKSLKHFDWSCLIPECTIGCNDAYKHGVDITKICYFGDVKFFKYYKEELSVFEGTCFTDAPSLYKNREKWLWILQRYTIISEKALGWFSSTGSGAVSLAILLGAKRIFLLGFDMCLAEDGESNWHPNMLDSPDAGIFKKFLEGFKRMKVELKEKHPDLEVINITDRSDLNEFPKVGVKEFWKNR